MKHDDELPEHKPREWTSISGWRFCCKTKSGPHAVDCTRRASALTKSDNWDPRVPSAAPIWCTTPGCRHYANVDSRGAFGPSCVGHARLTFRDTSPVPRRELPKCPGCGTEGGNAPGLCNVCQVACKRAAKALSDTRRSSSCHCPECDASRPRP